MNTIYSCAGKIFDTPKNLRGGMNMKLGKIIATGVLNLSLLMGTTYAAPAWTLPPNGKVLSDDVKQAYVADYMQKLFGEQIKIKFAAPDKWSYEIFTVNGVKVERLANPKAKKSSRVVLQLHGGGYIDGLTDLYRDLAVKQAVLTEAREVFMVDYRLVPENIYPCALEDAAQVYEELLARGIASKDIIVFGDSAGGNLALALSLKLKEEKLPQPAMLILNSPWTTLETDFPSREGNADRDVVLGRTNPRMNNGVANPLYAGKIPLNDPRLSPIYADLRGLPPILIQIGGYELFVDEGIELLRKATADELSVTLSVYPGMPHDFAMLIPDLDDSIKSFAEIRDFVNLNMSK